MKRILPRALAGLLLTTACDLTLQPETAEGAGVRAARLSVLLGSEIDGLPSELTAVQIEVFDLRVHRPSDDAWIMLAPEVVRVDITGDPDTFTHDGIPLRPDWYDEVQLVIGSVRVADGETWTPVELVEDELAAIVDWPLRNDAILEVRFDLATALRGSTAAGWRFTPTASAHLSTRE